MSFLFHSLLLVLLGFPSHFSLSLSLSPVLASSSLPFSFSFHFPSHSIFPLFKNPLSILSPFFLLLSPTFSFCPHFFLSSSLFLSPSLPFPLHSSLPPCLLLSPSLPHLLTSLLILLYQLLIEGRREGATRQAPSL